MDAMTRPQAVRLRRPGWRDPRLVAGLLLIAVAVTGVVALLRSADTTIPVYAAAVTLPPGAVLAPENTVVVDVRVGEGYLEADGEPPWGLALTRTVGAGELVPVAATAASDRVDGRPVAVTVGTPLAAGVEPGALVDVWVTPADGAASRLVGERLAVTDVVTDAGGLGPGGDTVYVRVPATEVGALLDALAQEGSVAVVGMG